MKESTQHRKYPDSYYYTQRAWDRAVGYGTVPDERNVEMRINEISTDLAETTTGSFKGDWCTSVSYEIEIESGETKTILGYLCQRDVGRKPSRAGRGYEPEKTIAYFTTPGPEGKELAQWDSYKKAMDSGQLKEIPWSEVE